MILKSDPMCTCRGCSFCEAAAHTPAALAGNVSVPWRRVMLLNFRPRSVRREEIPGPQLSQVPNSFPSVIVASARRAGFSDPFRLACDVEFFS